MTTTPPVLQVDGLSVDFPTPDGVVSAVRRLSFAVRRGEVLGVVGESGSGKSASGLAMMGLLPSSARVGGRVLLEGSDLLSMSRAQQRSIRGRTIAMVFQDPVTALNPVRSVGDQIAEAVRAHQPVSRRAALRTAAEALDLVGIASPAQRVNAYPHEFSGGMRQRVMIAMAIVNQPDVVIADEPTTALDVTVQAQILQLFVELKDAIGAAIVLITHDLGVVASTADRVLVMYAGRPVEVGLTTDVLINPRMPYTAALLRAVPVHGRSTESRLRAIPGEPPTLIDLPLGCSFASRCAIAKQRCRHVEPELLPTDREGHRAACIRWEQLAKVSR